MSKLITIQRSTTMLEEAQQDPGTRKWLGAAKKMIGSYFYNKSIATGLTYPEQQLLLPNYLGIQTDDKEWRKKVEEHYTNIYHTIGENGLTLETGLQDDTLAVGPTNLPIILKDYLDWRHIAGHPELAKNKQEALRDMTKKFYVYDPTQVSEDNLALITLADKALELYFRHKDDEIKTDHIITILGERSENLKGLEKSAKLRSLATPRTGENPYNQEQGLKRFIEAATDRDLEMKFLIKELIGLQYFKQVGQNIVFGDTGGKIGDNLQDAVLFLSNPKNARELNLAKAQYVTKSKRINSKDLVPKEVVVVTAPTV